MLLIADHYQKTFYLHVLMLSFGVVNSLYETIVLCHMCVCVCFLKLVGVRVREPLCCELGSTC